MKLRAFVIASLLPLMATQALSLSNGAYEGPGEWTTSSGESESTRMGFTITDNVVNGYWLLNEQQVTWSFTIVENGKFFDITSGDEIVGKGYCYGIQCHYSAVFDKNGQVEETWTFEQDNLYVIGSKSYGNQKAIWAAHLKRFEN